MKPKSLVVLLALACKTAFSQSSDSTKTVGGSTMYASKTVLENLKSSKDHSTFVNGVTTADIVNTLQGRGPYTVFAPTNDAFSKLPKGMWQTLMRPDQKANLADHIDYHIVAGIYYFKDLSKIIKDSSGKASLNTLSGAKLYLSHKDEQTIIITDEYKNSGTLTIPDINNSNAVLHVVDRLFRPKLPKDKKAPK